MIEIKILIDSKCMGRPLNQGFRIQRFISSFSHICLLLGWMPEPLSKYNKELVSVSLEDLVLAGKESILVPSR